MPNEETSKLTAAECGVYADRLTELADELRQLASENQEIWVFRKPSLKLAVDRAESFHQELKKSIEATRLGTPYSENTEKGRRTKKPMPQIPGTRITSDEELAEAERREEGIEATAARAKKTTKKAAVRKKVASPRKSSKKTKEG